MPRKNQRRKNANSQPSGRRKAKPIKFNPSDIENEQKRLCASPAVDDAIDDDQQSHDQEMESIDGSVPIGEDDDDDDNDENDIENSSNNPIIVDTMSDDNEINRSNQSDGSENDASTPTPAVCNDSPNDNRTFICNFKCRNYFFPFFAIELISFFWGRRKGMDEEKKN